MDRTRRLALSLVILVTLGLTACGSSGKLSKADLVAKGDKICQEARDKGAKLPRPSSLADIKKLGPDEAKIVDDTVSKLKDLTPPDSVKSDYDAYVKIGARQADLARKLGEAAKAGKGQAISEVKKVLTESKQNLTTSRSLAQKVGFKVCGNGS